MSFKNFLLILIVALILSGLSFALNLDQHLPAFIAYFCISLLTATIVLFSFDTSSSPKRKKKRKERKPADLINDGQKEIGHVKWFSTNKGFGFITRENGEEIFVHFRSIVGRGHRALREGQQVEYSVSEGSKGLQAEEVSAIN